MSRVTYEYRLQDVTVTSTSHAGWRSGTASKTFTVTVILLKLKLIRVWFDSKYGFSVPQSFGH